MRPANNGVPEMKANPLQRSVSALVIAGAVFVFSGHNATSAKEENYRDLTFQVIDEQERPVAELEVSLRGRGRDTITALLDKKYYEERGDKYEGWTFHTDAQGKFTARFGKFQLYEHEKATHVVAPGYGSFHLIVEKEGYAGGVSRRILNLNDEDRGAYKPREYAGGLPLPGEEWDGDEYVLNDQPAAAPLQIVLRKGMEVSGQLVDPESRPIARETLYLQNDLGAGTHTGRGGEIFERSAKTDRQGRFRFHNVYPNMFYLALESEDDANDHSLYWIKTRIRDRWVDGIADAIWPHTHELDLPLVIEAARKPPCRYFGKVSDEKGRPIAGATVRIQVSLHGPTERQDFEDGHSHLSQTQTRKDGSFEVRAAAPYVNWFEITAPEFERTMYEEDGEIEGLGLYEEVPCAPGRYDFIMKRK